MPTKERGVVMNRFDNIFEYRCRHELEFGWPLIQNSSQTLNERLLLHMAIPE
jgi:hypothetical protein